jgi:hypothetical protein
MRGYGVEIFAADMRGKPAAAATALDVCAD